MKVVTSRDLKSEDLKISLQFHAFDFYISGDYKHLNFAVYAELNCAEYLHGVHTELQLD